MCQKTACGNWHGKFQVSCKYCRENYSKPCAKFNTAKEVLFKNISKSAKDYLENFIKDFLSLSSESLQCHYKVSESVMVAREKISNVKSYHKSEKNRSQVVYRKFENCKKLNYNIKDKKRTFYKKF